MPKIVKKCWEKIKMHSNGHPVILITINNYQNYIDVDQEILRKFNEGILLPAIFADLIRLKLLAVYGGLWIDATIYLTEDLKDDYFNKQFFSIKNYPISNFSVSDYKWCSFFLGATKESPYFKQLSIAFEKYLHDKKYIMNYLMIDYFIDILYQNDDTFRLLIDAVPITNEHMHTLRENFNKPHNSNIWKKWLSDTCIFKLTYKGNLQCVDDNNRTTFFGFIMSK